MPCGLAWISLGLLPSPLPQLALGSLQSTGAPATGCPVHVSVGGPLHSHCLGVQGPTPASIPCMGAPHPYTPGCGTWNKASAAVLLPRARGGPMKTEEGWGAPPSPSPTLTPSGLETELRLALKWPFVYCPWRTDEPGGRGWHCRGCLGRAVLNSAGFGEQGECPASCGQAYCPRHPQTRRYLSLRIRHLLRVPLSFNSCLWSALSRPGFVLGGEE